MATCLGKSWSFCLPCVNFVNVYQFLCVHLFWFEVRMWDLIYQSVPDHGLSFYFIKKTTDQGPHFTFHTNMKSLRMRIL